MSIIQEVVFTHAVALHQSGRLKNTVYASGHTAFILNMDKTVLLRFSLPVHEAGIKGEISFMANDYDSDNFKEEDGRIVFTSHDGDYTRQKSCVAPEKNFREVEELWSSYVELDRKQHHNEKVFFSKKILSMLDEGLSHMEIFSENKSPVVVQRDIYTGSIITITHDAAGGLGMDVTHEIKEDFGPIGIRTNDFIALFSFCDIVNFYFVHESPFALVMGDKLSMNGVVAGCAYDEMGETTISKEEKHGREKPKNRRSQQEVDTTAGETEGQEQVQTEKPIRRRRGRQRPEGQDGTGLLT